MRALALSALLLTACDLGGPPSPWTRSSLLSEGAERVLIESRMWPSIPDNQTEYRVLFSHDGGRSSRPVTEGKIEHFDRRARALRLPDGRLAVAVFTDLCVETARTSVTCSRLETGSLPPQDARPMLAWLAYDRLVENYVRAGAALTLARMRAPEAAAVLTTLLGEDTHWDDQGAALRASLASLSRVRRTTRSGATP